MFVRFLIGNLAGQIVEMPYTVAENNLANGTAVTVTEAEIRAFGLTPSFEGLVESVEVPPRGFRVEPSPDGRRGWVVYDPGGIQITDDPFPNPPAAREWAHRYVRTAMGQDEEIEAKRARIRGPIGETVVDHTGARERPVSPPFGTEQRKANAVEPAVQLPVGSEAPPSPAPEKTVSPTPSAPAKPSGMGTKDAPGR